MQQAKKINIALKDNQYDIFIGNDLIGNAGERLKQQFSGARFGIITDENVASYHLKALTNSLDETGLDYTIITIKAGESSKSFAMLEHVINKILAARLERNDIIIAFGGGVIGDLAGFAAAIARRGMDFVQIPTSLLAQVDSAVGGKTGINAIAGKNLVGAFHQPKLVLSDLGVLKTLPKRHFRSGYAEIVKYGLIDDEDFFFWLEENHIDIFSHKDALSKAIAHSCAAKSRFVIADEKEAGSRALLNLGHTFGHALEAYTGYSDRLYHGEGVAIGIVLAHMFSAKLGLAPSQDAIRVKKHFELVGLPTSIKDIKGEKPTIEQLMSAIMQDKKVKRGTLTFILTKAIGNSFIANNIDANILTEFLEEIIST